GKELVGCFCEYNSKGKLALMPFDCKALREKLWEKNALQIASALSSLFPQAQQLTDLEQKLAVAKDELEKAALDKESQLKALKETVQICLSSVLHSQPPATNLIPSKPAEKLTSPVTKGSKVPFQVTSTKRNASAEKENLHVASRKEENQSIQECDSQNVGKTCLGNRNNSTSHLKTAGTETSFQKLHSPPWTKPGDKKSPERNEKKYEESVSTKEKKL
ncbi:PREDICTED: leucine zipper protein 2, partial [Phaethon lepturus]|uniref:leucine zipper protein 2 n=1 Tax=Phaethon lepturus TaxID=97097 RepID=UPI00053098DA